MSTLFDGNIHAGLSGLELEEELFELGDGITLRKTYAHLMAPFMVAFKPAPPGGHHPTPWKTASGGVSIDVNAELFIPSHIEEQYGSRIGIARTLVFLIRLTVNPATTLPVFSNYAFASHKDIPDNQFILFPFETQTRYFPIGVVGGKANADTLVWVRDQWQTVHKLISENTEFSFAVEAIDMGQFVQNSTLTMVSLWGALEALFSPSANELKFRVSSLIASYLEAPGVKRLELQKEVAKLYDKRSAAAHGKPTHKSKDLLDTFNLLRKILMIIILRKKVPSKDDLEGMLFGSVSHEDN